MYRTGDLGRLRADGCLEHLGRSDARLKIRGQWVALADVESALARMDEVRAAVVAARDNAAGDTRLVAYIVPENDHAPPASALRRRLAVELPAHMVPAHYVMLEALPVSDNGKVDRRALPAPPEGRPTLEQAYVSPSSLLQQRIALVWEEVLGVYPVGVRDNFLDLGGDSLLAVSMVDRLEAVLGREIPVTALFEAADVQTLADLLFEHHADLRFPLLRVQPGGTKPPFFFLHGDYLSGGFYCLELARHLGPDQPFFALPPYGLDSRPVPESYEQMAAQHIQTLRAFRPNGPYRLGGTCNGGMVAFEMARQLVQAGQSVDLLLLIGSSAENARFRLMKQSITAAGAMLRVPSRFQMALYEVLRSTLLERSGRPLWSAAARLLAKLRKVHPLRSTAVSTSRGSQPAACGPWRRDTGGAAEPLARDVPAYRSPLHPRAVREPGHALLGGERSGTGSAGSPTVGAGGAEGGPACDSRYPPRFPDRGRAGARATRKALLDVGTRHAVSGAARDTACRVPTHGSPRTFVLASQARGLCASLGSDARQAAAGVDPLLDLQPALLQLAVGDATRRPSRGRVGRACCRG